MARNEEKKQSMLNRFLQGKKDDSATQKQRRPYLASECSNLAEADKWRYQIVKEIAKKVGDIQNPGLGEHLLRELNDEINKLIREKGHWERRIKELGGPDYSKLAKATDAQGDLVSDATGKGAGYRYFGAARNLPGVRELFETDGPKHVRKTRQQMHALIDADYYGFRDEEDGVLVELEAEAEVGMRAALQSEWEEREREKTSAMASTSRVAASLLASKSSDGVAATEFVAYVPLPDTSAIEERIVDKKKRELMAKYMSDELMRSQQDVSKLRHGE